MISICQLLFDIPSQTHRETAIFFFVFHDEAAHSTFQQIMAKAELSISEAFDALFANGYIDYLLNSIQLI